MGKIVIAKKYEMHFGETSKQWYWDGEAWTGEMRDASSENIQPVGYASGPKSFATEQDMREIKTGKNLIVAVIVVCLAVSFLSTAMSAGVSYASGDTSEATYEMV